MKKILSTIVPFLIIISNAMAVEEVNYEIMKTNEVYEIRKYSDLLVVETITSNENSGFRKLFNYISGQNERNEEIKMTAPVTQLTKNGDTFMQFYLPSKFNKENIPDPSNSNVKISTMKAGYYAVITYSGRNSENNFIKHKNILEEELKKNNISILSSAIKASYNSPFTLPMMRRNEAMYKIDFKTAT
tara:strand:+ start:1782 stop:2345 length:564 start_codon:yes stop_codon:yes gene_type:complete